MVILVSLLIFLAFLQVPPVTRTVAVKYRPGGCIHESLDNYLVMPVGASIDRCENIRRFLQSFFKLPNILWISEKFFALWIDMYNLFIIYIRYVQLKYIIDWDFYIRTMILIHIFQKRVSYTILNLTYWNFYFIIFSSQVHNQLRTTQKILRHKDFTWYITLHKTFNNNRKLINLL